ncbi:carbohydrate ABC transporter membrane protein 1, CUT1 family [Ferrithrix thermotolerans DSM 19514]|uniref:Carbohydrate ABC transporter membrane protein 1, CUT1 family n=1 Tax=Ferrithrix thermotolerans DSM 19514 TaxID=1121881 RepID=A0A1M4UZT7_9ACTN|nr:sugar ABC transporter permease [Ferrithrix thermotolerans]SHE62236.1 carbohydrate ABC transporter membrane protein 1, CUT1 family [Ferrithrix thermotolerans DSM 19514]
MAAVTGVDSVVKVMDKRGHRDVHSLRQARIGWMFSTPALVFIGLVTIFPIGFSVALSLSNVNVTGNGFALQGFTFSNYSQLIHSSTWRYALVFTVFYTVVTVAVEVVLGTMIALVLERLTKARGMMMALLLLPWSIITVISAELWQYIYEGTYGVLQAIFQSIGLGAPVFLGSPTSAIISMMVADIWKTTPFVAVIVIAGLVMLPSDVYEAASCDGASNWTIFWKITLPLLRPTIAIAVLFRVLQAFGVFDLPFVLTGGGPGTATTSLAILSYKVMFQNIDYGPGAAVAVSATLLVILGCLLFLRVFKTQVGREEVQ